MRFAKLSSGTSTAMKVSRILTTVDSTESMACAICPT